MSQRGTQMRILIAGIPETRERLLRLFADSDVKFVTTMHEAQEALLSPLDAVVVAVRFDESRMFDLLRHIKDDGSLARLPIVCYRTESGPVTTTALALQAVQLATRSLGAADFVDLAGGHVDKRLKDAVFAAIAAVRQQPKKI